MRFLVYTQVYGPFPRQMAPFMGQGTSSYRWRSGSGGNAERTRLQYLLSLLQQAANNGRRGDQDLGSGGSSYIDEEEEDEDMDSNSSSRTVALAPSSQEPSKRSKLKVLRL